jgi:hypothetical protein
MSLTAGSTTLCSVTLSMPVSNHYAQTFTAAATQEAINARSMQIMPYRRVWGASKPAHTRRASTAQLCTKAMARSVQARTNCCCYPYNIGFRYSCSSDACSGHICRPAARRATVSTGHCALAGPGLQATVQRVVHVMQKHATESHAAVKHALHTQTHAHILWELYQ